MVKKNANDQNMYPIEDIKLEEQSSTAVPENTRVSRIGGNAFTPVAMSAFTVNPSQSKLARNLKLNRKRALETQIVGETFSKILPYMEINSSLKDVVAIGREVTRQTANSSVSKLGTAGSLAFNTQLITSSIGALIAPKLGVLQGLTANQPLSKPSNKDVLTELKNSQAGSVAFLPQIVTSGLTQELLNKLLGIL